MSPRRAVAALGALALAACALSCAGGETPPATTAPAPALLEAMRDHAAHGSAMRDAVEKADLLRARTEAAALGQTRAESGGDEAWQSRVDAMTSAAAKVAKAENLGDASRDVAAVATTCGGCHAVYARTRKVVVSETPASGVDVVPRMRRHQWAAARLWSGLVIPSSEAWTAGARALGEAPLEPEQVAPGKTPGHAIGDLARGVQDLGRRAVSATTGANREKVYGELLTTCSQCHAFLVAPDPRHP